jgi:hypothetical protein
MQKYEVIETVDFNEKKLNEFRQICIREALEAIEKKGLQWCLDEVKRLEEVNKSSIKAS